MGVLQEGELLEMGSHPELIAKQGVYSEMWARQVSSGSVLQLTYRMP